MRLPLNFGVVVTLKEINGINRIEDFIKACILRGWIVNRIDDSEPVEYICGWSGSRYILSKFVTVNYLRKLLSVKDDASEFFI